MSEFGKDQPLNEYERVSEYEYWLVEGDFVGFLMGLRLGTFLASVQMLCLVLC